MYRRQCIAPDGPQTFIAYIYKLTNSLSKADKMRVAIGEFYLINRQLTVYEFLFIPLKWLILSHLNCKRTHRVYLYAFSIQLVYLLVYLDCYTVKRRVCLASSSIKKKITSFCHRLSMRTDIFLFQCFLMFGEEHELLCSVHGFGIQ